MKDNIIPINRATKEAVLRTMSNLELTHLLIPILRRRVASPLQGTTLTLVFDTEIEAVECQRILASIRPRRKRRRAAALSGEGK